MRWSAGMAGAYEQIDAMISNKVIVTVGDGVLR